LAAERGAETRRARSARRGAWDLEEDLHALFDAGYVTVMSLELCVSRRIREQFENGRDYCALEGASVRVPLPPQHRHHPNTSSGTGTRWPACPRV